MTSGAGIFWMLAPLQTAYLGRSLLVGRFTFRGGYVVERVVESGRFRLFTAGIAISAVALWAAAVFPWMRDPL